ncbi:hypothetical protein N658DRAFT_174205 [Parathielavia hyrcaniae]|uniref:Uncharacterized protein n=1 Tax=Parathielavia hyrcaniae TaxID=113614 RepID=A0AAN6PW95_9PEZI|nr:hypothetical protein N658DRAFT_174205 [Parathielavia hyrcaniae]
MTDSLFSTPKRKRCEVLNDGLSKLDIGAQFTFDLADYSAPDDDKASPRTRVAHRFRGLQLGGGGGGGPSADRVGVDNDDDGPRKRVKLPDVEMLDVKKKADAAEHVHRSMPRRTQTVDEEGGANRQYKSYPIFLDDDSSYSSSETLVNTSADDNGSTTTPSLSPPSPPPPSHAQRQPRNRTFKRAGTPPFPSTAKHTTKPPSKITDPLRTSLTWHEDEITIYDPDDSDDDGTGINGIGFKPTPAIAYARAVRRRQQLAEYKKREEREARARRSRRRRGGSPMPGTLGLAGTDNTKGEREPRRRVRFLDREGGGGELIGD